MMARSFLQLQKLLPKMLAAFLAITLSGAYCLFCCQEANAAAKADFCPLAKTNHCNSSKSRVPEVSQTAANLNPFECCGLKFNFFVANLEKHQFSPQTPATANNFSYFRQTVKFENNRKSPVFYERTTIFRSGKLQVKNCVFRI